jgi:hypothetical protein
MKYSSSLLLALGRVVLSAAKYNFETSLPWSPAQSGSVDQSTVSNGVYYLADRTNAGVSTGPLPIDFPNKYLKSGHRCTS